MADRKYIFKPLSINLPPISGTMRDNRSSMHQAIERHVTEVVSCDKHGDDDQGYFIWHCIAPTGSGSRREPIVVMYYGAG